MKKIFVLFFSASLLLSSCAKETSNLKMVLDREGNKVEVPQEVTKIVSTAPSNTEILIGLGLSKNIVAVDNYSPLEALNKDIAIIDFSAPDIEALIDLEPDIIIASSHNKIEGEDPFAPLKNVGISVVYIPSSNSIEAIYQDISFIGEITSKEIEAEAMIKEMKQEINEIRALSETVSVKKTVYFELGDYDGILYSLGKETFIDDILNIVGATNIFAEQTSWISVSAEDIIDRNPDVIVTNNSFDQDAVQKIQKRTGFSVITAVKSNNINVVDSNKTSRGSQNIIQGIKEIAEAIYPGVYDFE